MAEVKRGLSSGIRLWLHKVTALSTDIARMDVLSLNYWLSKFVVEVAKTSGERYPLKTVYGIINFVHSSVNWRRKMDPKL